MYQRIAATGKLSLVCPLYSGKQRGCYFHVVPCVGLQCLNVSLPAIENEPIISKINFIFLDSTETPGSDIMLFCALLIQ